MARLAHPNLSHDWWWYAAFMSIGFTLSYNRKKWSLRGILQVITNHMATLFRINYPFFPCLKTRGIPRYSDSWKPHRSWYLRSWYLRTTLRVLIDSGPCSKTPPKAHSGAEKSPVSWNTLHETIFWSQALETMPIWKPKAHAGPKPFSLRVWMAIENRV